MKDGEKIPLIKKEKRRTTKQSRKYYEELEELERAYEEDELTIQGKFVANEDEKTKADNILSKIVFAANIALLIAKIAATYFTSGTSLSIISTLLDSVVDITSSIGIWYTSHAIMTADSFRYPRGRENLELISFIFIGVVMGMANVYIMFQSITRILFLEVVPDITVVALAILFGTIVTKSILLLICLRVKSPSAKVLLIDQRNDVLTNIVGMGGAILAKYWTPYADPVAACFIAGYIAFSWAGVVVEQLPILSGKQCSKSEYSRIARILITQNKRVLMVETLLVYHTGLKVRVEAHVVLDPDTPAKIVHDEVESPLKKMLERLPFVERAFVHPDYECDGYEK
ncbi:hypothetical protein PFISCL1PPCAC_27374 [Pristionchus fissidentatus]|uniref:Cation efflux protein transmembrane domain-containing protein n=1 Tax=Pristionchus fissidentatus TaxID=1538716 RepID=A0AAV5WYH0_9BILA|nr:hypothetical protein PFISCL1PPCAC_27374 [Pristionchus fissidentatus]